MLQSSEERARQERIRLEKEIASLQQQLDARLDEIKSSQNKITEVIIILIVVDYV